VKACNGSDRSFAGKAIAVKRVTENQGKNTPGVDRQTWSTPEAKRQAMETLERRDTSRSR